jgi:hypothetical protein
VPLASPVLMYDVVLAAVVATGVKPELADIDRSI